ncbi:MAG: NAD(P)-dependent oxidoreductase [Planctomycetota bacterium]|nr:MAG: NAD(P)-dependent oxidoreductase [Planctomycetota bacterium]
MARVLVTGANGFVGSHLVEHLLSLGHEVTCLVRRTSNLQWIEALPVRFAYGEARLPESLPPVVKGQEYIFHNAGVTRAWNARGYIETNALGTRNMLRACAAAGDSIRKFVLVSSQAAAGPCRDGRVVTEDDTPRPVSHYGRSKLLAEKFAHRFENRLPVTIVRPSAVYGPRDRDGLDLFKNARRHLATIVGFRRASLLSTHVRDIVEGIALAGLAEESAGRTYFISYDKPHSWEEITDAIGEVVGKTAIRLRVHGDTVKLLGRWITALAATARALGLRPERSGPPLLTVARSIELAQRCWLCSCERAKKELAFSPKIGLREGIRLTAEWYRREGWI